MNSERISEASEANNGNVHRIYSRISCSCVKEIKNYFVMFVIIMIDVICSSPSQHSFVHHHQKYLQHMFYNKSVKMTYSHEPLGIQYSLICLFVSGSCNIISWHIIVLSFIVVFSRTSRLIKLQKLHKTKTLSKIGFIPRKLFLIIRPLQYKGVTSLLKLAEYLLTHYLPFKSQSDSSRSPSLMW